MKVRAYVLMAPDGTYQVGGFGGPGSSECNGSPCDLSDLYDSMSLEDDVDCCELSIVEADVEPPRPVQVVQGTVVT